MLDFLKNNTKASSKQQLDIVSIEDDLLHLSNHRYRAIIQISTINFELKSESEKDIITEIYQNFLNALPSRIQIYIQVRELDLKTYTSNFRASLKNKTSYIKYKNQINNYIDFVNNLSHKNKILTRLFYLIIPLDDLNNNYIEAKDKLNINCDIIQKNLTKLKLSTKRLNSLDIFNLFYEIYNPDIYKIQPINQELINNLKRGII